MKKQIARKQVKKLSVRKVKLKNFRPQIKSRHPSHSPLREELPLMPFKSIIRLGSQTELGDEVSNGGERVEINTAVACSISSDKQLMKEAFDDKKVRTAEWINADDPLEIAWLKDDGKIIVKPRFGSRG